MLACSSPADLLPASVGALAIRQVIADFTHAAQGAQPLTADHITDELQKLERALAVGDHAEAADRLDRLELLCPDAAAVDALCLAHIALEGTAAPDAATAAP